ncbi:MAG: WYL domain-containing protein [Lachnospiraceae bacterium]|nr:WYL domain-containing protein [Lachnospiraceae bacterium]
MAYSEFIKKFNRIREYMREFYVYGFKTRDEFTLKSKRSYDDEKRRVESLLGDYMSFKQTSEGKNVFISIDSRVSHHNPLYKAWKAKSFTDGSITLHFILMDIFAENEDSLSLRDIEDLVCAYLADFEEQTTFDESTIRKKLNEYVKEGIVLSEKRGKVAFYKRAPEMDDFNEDALDFFSEVLPCGVVGSFILDKMNKDEGMFRFKHHYITGALDSEIMCSLFDAIHEKREINLEFVKRNVNLDSEGNAENRLCIVTPVMVMISVQSGREHLIAYNGENDMFYSYRLDSIEKVELKDVSENFDDFRNLFLERLPHLWGVSTHNRTNVELETVEFTVTYGDDEKYIRDRLEREKRCGTVEHLDNNTSRFRAVVYDSLELVPWIRTFICRISDIHFSNEEIEERFKNDIDEMYELYGISDEIEEGEVTEDDI